MDKYPKATAKEIRTLITSGNWGNPAKLTAKREPHAIDDNGTPGYWFVVYHADAADPVAAFVEA